MLVKEKYSLIWFVSQIIYNTHFRSFSHNPTFYSIPFSFDNHLILLFLIFFLLFLFLFCFKIKYSTVCWQFLLKVVLNNLIKKKKWPRKLINSTSAFSNWMLQAIIFKWVNTWPSHQFAFILWVYDFSFLEKCMHRFCGECIKRSLRHNKKECPTCRQPCASKRALRRDTDFDRLIKIMFPDPSILERYQDQVRLLLIFYFIFLQKSFNYNVWCWKCGLADDWTPTSHHEYARFSPKRPGRHGGMHSFTSHTLFFINT